jgi:DNA-3-methyladenine glycosylase II
VEGEILHEGSLSRGTDSPHGSADARRKEFIRNYIADWLDLGRDMRPFYELLRKDKRLAYMCETFGGLRLIGIVDLFEALSWSIIGQQINLTFAFRLKRRLVEKYGERLDFEGEAYYLFPNYAALAGATVEELREMQFSRSKAAYLIGLAASFAKGELSMEILRGLPDMESRQKALIALKGIGIWTANYTLMKTLREPSSIPYGDTGLLTALANHAVIKERSEVEKIERFFKKYKGWESYLVFYLWRSLAAPAPLPPAPLPPAP